MTTQDKPQKASTVILIKITTKWPHKVLLIKRSEKASFLPGAYVFPGGRVEKSDEIFAEFLSSDNKNIERFQRFFKKDKSIVARYVAAAIRETLEETGLFILSLNKNGPNVLDKGERLGLINGTIKTSLTKPVLDNLWPISWWITPPGETRRFDTWFFLSFLDNSSDYEGEAYLEAETSQGVWLLPSEALLAYEEKRIFLAPPTRAILERMSATENLEEFLGFVDEPLFPIKPRFVVEADGKKMLVLPGDPLHKEPKKPSMLTKTRYPFP